MHRLNPVLAGLPAPHSPNLRLTGERLPVSPVDWYGPAILVNKTTVVAHPHSMARLPVLLPTGHSALRP
jgi:LysR family transcriptional activator of nhaA